MHKKIKIFVVILRTKNPPNLQIGNVDLSNIKDGVYVGSADNGLVDAISSATYSSDTLRKAVENALRQGE